MTYVGHILRKKGNCLGKEIIQGITPGSHLIMTMEDREKWRKIVSDASKLRSEDG